MNPAEWSIRLLRLPVRETDPSSRGLILIQLDGVSRHRLLAGIEEGRMPFLKHLLNKDYYHIVPYYSGLPSTTPSIQGELFYGQKQSVPAFEFLDKEVGQVVRMYDPETVKRIQKHLADNADFSLLEGGSSYANIYDGGADESHFCVVSLGWNSLWRKARPWRWILFYGVHLFDLLRTAGLMIIEFLLSTLDFLKGILRKQNTWKEFKFIPTRIGLCILMRDLIDLGVRTDAVRGLSIIHANFLGQDEHAHRRGPSADFSQRTLKGIDQAVKRIYRSARKSPRRDYDVWIYSDHGQDDAVPYRNVRGRTINEEIAEIINSRQGETAISSQDMSKPAHSIQLKRIQYLIHKAASPLIKPERRQKHFTLTTLGPIGHLYLNFAINEQQADKLAQEILQKTAVPILLRTASETSASVWTQEGCYQLPRDARKIFGQDHPRLSLITQDMIQLCRHPNAGDFVLSGFRIGKKPYTFAQENGCHAGPGIGETDAFIMTPRDIFSRNQTRQALSTQDLRTAARNHCKPWQGSIKQSKPHSAAYHLRIMTYNVHGCVGTDGRLSPERIGRVIARYHPDIVCLQEMDLNRRRSAWRDQAAIIAAYMDMDYHFHPVMRIKEGGYGNAILSRYPLHMIRKSGLWIPHHHSPKEPRGAMMCSITMNEQTIKLINTHLGLGYFERRKQIQELMGENWLGHPSCTGPVILCGDLNTPPQSSTCRAIETRLTNCQSKIPSHRNQTWHSTYPVRQIDHIFISQEIRVDRVRTPRTHLERLASDHLPYIADLTING
ncbi:MAG: endonuclease/exonuclease/phosphatase family protein [Candidatus Omnitrophota bacterium]